MIPKEFWDPERAKEGQEKPIFRTTVWIMWILSPPFSWVLKPQRGSDPTTLSHILYLLVPRLLHPWEFLGFAFGFVKVKPWYFKHTFATTFWLGQAGGAQLHSWFITTHFTGTKMLFLSLGAAGKESKELEAERSEFLLLRLSCPLFRPTAFLKHEREKKSGPFLANHSQ